MDDLALKQSRAQKAREYESKFRELEGKLSTAGYKMALAALYYSQKAHEANSAKHKYRKDDVTPSHMHEVLLALRMFTHHETLKKAGVNPDKLIAMLLAHDNPEDDPDLTKDMMKQRINDEIRALFPKTSRQITRRTADVVDGAFALSKIRNKKTISNAIYFASVGEDPVKLLAKLGDREHNTETIHFLKPEKQLAYLKESREFLKMARKAKQKYQKLELVIDHYINSIQTHLNNYVSYVNAMNPEDRQKILDGLHSERRIQPPRRKKAGVGKSAETRAALARS